MFRLTRRERAEVVTFCDHLQALKFSPVPPLAFTEQGVAMLSSVVHSERAIKVNIAIMRAFVRLREVLATNKALAGRLESIERRLGRRNEEFSREIRAIWDAINELMAPPKTPRKRIGFHQD